MPKQTSTLHIDGMSCGHCLNAVNRAIRSVPGAEIVSVAIGRAAVSCEPDSLSGVVAAIEAAGYRVAPPVTDPPTP